jgi:predicted nucleotidyltransferase
MRRSAPIGYVQPYRYPSPNIPLSAIRRFVRRIVERFQPQKIVLFGSYAYGTPYAESDVDLLVIMPARNEIGKSARITLAFDPPFAIDLIVRTPQHVERGLKGGDWFLREVMERGKVLYESRHRRLGPESRRRPRQRETPGATPPIQGSSLLPLPASGGKVTKGISARTRRARSSDP